MNREEALEHLIEVRETTYELLRLWYKKRSLINEDIKEAKELIDEVEAEIRRLIEI